MDRNKQQHKQPVQQKQSRTKEPAGTQPLQMQEKNALHASLDKKQERQKKQFNRDDMPLL